MRPSSVTMVFLAGKPGKLRVYPSRISESTSGPSPVGLRPTLSGLPRGKMTAIASICSAASSTKPPRIGIIHYKLDEYLRTLSGFFVPTCWHQLVITSLPTTLNQRMAMKFPRNPSPLRFLLLGSEGWGTWPEIQWPKLPENCWSCFIKVEFKIQSWRSP